MHVCHATLTKSKEKFYCGNMKYFKTYSKYHLVSYKKN